MNLKRDLLIFLACVAVALAAILCFDILAPAGGS